MLIALLAYGLLQEKIMSGTYDGERFQDSVFLVFVNRVVALLFATVMALIHKEGLMNVAPMWKYVAISVSNVYASSCQYEALKYVSFPVQMLGKSFKMMPVMVWGMAVGGKSYKLMDWIVALAVTGGVTEFLLTGPTSAVPGYKTSLIGMCLLALFLMLDGFTSAYQEVLFKEYKTSKYNQMIWINLGSCLVSSITVLLGDSLGISVTFMRSHPAFLADALLLSVAAVAAQWFIYSQVKEFGALVFAATMNVRQVVSILSSYITYGHTITGLQVCGLVLVFAVLFLKSMVSLMSSRSERSERSPLVAKKRAKAAGENV